MVVFCRERLQMDCTNFVYSNQTERRARVVGSESF